MGREKPTPTSKKIEKMNDNQTDMYIDGFFPMTGILTIENPTDDMKQQIADGTLNFDKSMSKEPMISIHPLSHAKEFRGKKSLKTISPSLRATDYKCPHVVYVPHEPLCKYISCAIRGRKDGHSYLQNIEIGNDVANALTSVHKDSMVFESEDPSIISLVPWDRPGGDMGDIAPSITSSAWQHNNFLKLPIDGQPMVMADPRKNYGRFLPSSESSPTLLSTDYKSPRLVMENAAETVSGLVVIRAYEIIWRMVEDSQNQDSCVNVNPYQNIRIFSIKPIVKTKESTTRFRIRKLTPRECYRLMDVPEKNINRLLASGISKSQHYKLAGNSIVVSCLYHIFKSLFTNEIPENQQLSLF